MGTVSNFPLKINEQFSGQTVDMNRNEYTSKVGHSLFLISFLSLSYSWMTSMTVKSYKLPFE